MRAYIEPDDEHYPMAIIEVRDSEGNIVEAHAWLTAPKKWTLELNDPLQNVDDIYQEAYDWLAREGGDEVEEEDDT